MSKRNQRRQRRRTGRGILFLIGGLFLASGILRLGDGTGEAIAKNVEALRSKAMPSSAPVACKAPEGIGKMLTALRARETAVTRREAKLADRLQVLKLAEADIKQNMSALTSAEDALKSTISRADTASEDDLTRLTAVYENMKPKGAAALFEQMDPKFSAGFLARMRPESAAGIMARLTPKKAYTISVVLAGRNASVPIK